MIFLVRYWEQKRKKILQLLFLSSVYTFFAIVVIGCQQSPESKIVDVRRLAPLGKPGATELLWSPVDQNKILVLASYPDFNGGEIFIVNVETEEKQLLVQANHGFLGIRTWSHDGKSIIMAASTSTEGFEQGGIWEVDLDNNTFLYLQSEANRVSLGPDHNSFTLAKSRFVEPGHEKTEIVWIDRITHKETVIFETQLDQAILGFSWSSDGKQLVFSLGDIQPPGSNFNIYVLDITSRELRQITYDGDNKYPVWSPTSDIIAYVKKVYNGKVAMTSLYLYELNDSCNIKLVESIFSKPSWSPDGTQLAFIAVASGDIYIADITKLLADNYKKICD